MKLIYSSLIFALCLLACQSPESSSVAVASPEGASQSLLQSLDAWKMGEGMRVSQTESGWQLTSESEDGWMRLPQSLEDFHLQVELDLDSTTEGWLAFRTEEVEKGQGYFLSLQGNANTQHPFGSLRETARATWLDSLGAQRLSITALGDHLLIEQNGQKIAEVHDRAFRNGGLAIQAKQLLIRKLDLQPLETVQVAGPTLEEWYRTYEDRPLEPATSDFSLKGWDYTGTSIWKIKEGEIHGFSGKEGGYLISQNQYQNFYAKFEFRIKEEDNSGVFIRHDTTQKTVSPTQSIECNVYDHNGYSHAYSTGSVAGQARAFKGLIEYNSWNEMEIFAHEDQVVLYVNGQKSSEVHVPAQMVKPGSICLQAGLRIFSDNGPSLVSYRNIQVKNMDGITL
ncbi:MAG: family 16 glycoside hydrolase [Bacteroidota bacterium]